MSDTSTSLEFKKLPRELQEWSNEIAIFANELYKVKGIIDMPDYERVKSAFETVLIFKRLFPHGYIPEVSKLKEAMQTLEAIGGTSKLLAKMIKGRFVMGAFIWELSKELKNQGYTEEKLQKIVEERRAGVYDPIFSLFLEEVDHISQHALLEIYEKIAEGANSESKISGYQLLALEYIDSHGVLHVDANAIKFIGCPTEQSLHGIMDRLDGLGFVQKEKTGKMVGGKSVVRFILTTKGRWFCQRIREVGKWPPSGYAKVAPKRTFVISEFTHERK